MTPLHIMEYILFTDDLENIFEIEIEIKEVKKVAGTPGQRHNEGPGVLLAVINLGPDTNHPGGHVTSGDGW